MRTHSKGKRRATAAAAAAALSVPGARIASDAEAGHSRRKRTLGAVRARRDARRRVRAEAAVPAQAHARRRRHHEASTATAADRATEHAPAPAPATPAAQPAHARRAATLYDAVAGRLTTNGFQVLASALASGQAGAGSSSNMQALDPVTALFHVAINPILTTDTSTAAFAATDATASDAADAPTTAAATTTQQPRKELGSRSRRQTDEQRARQRAVYDSWVRALPGELELPRGELCEAVHAYVADFYCGGGRHSGHSGGGGEGRGRGREDRGDTTSNAAGRGLEDATRGMMRQNMDGSALLAASILLEELARESLGDAGELALLESAEADGGDDGGAAGLRERVWFNGVRRVPFVVDHEDASRGGGGSGKAKPDYEVEEGSLLEALLS